MQSASEQRYTKHTQLNCRPMLGMLRANRYSHLHHTTCVHHAAHHAAPLIHATVKFCDMSAGSSQVGATGGHHHQPGRPHQCAGGPESDQCQDPHREDDRGGRCAH